MTRQLDRLNELCYGYNKVVYSLLALYKNQATTDEERATLGECISKLSTLENGVLLARSAALKSFNQMAQNLGGQI